MCKNHSKEKSRIVKLFIEMHNNFRFIFIEEHGRVMLNNLREFVPIV